MFGKKYLLLEIDKSEAEFYHLPAIVPYPSKEQRNLDRDGFSWELSIKAMQDLLKSDSSEEYKPYRLFVQKWKLYAGLDLALKSSNWLEAESIIQNIFTIDLLDPSAHLNLGFVYQAQKMYAEAIHTYTKGSELVENRSPFILALASCYEEIGNEDEAFYLWDQIKNISTIAMQKLIEYRVYKINSDSADINYTRLAEKTFQKFFNNSEKLIELGINLSHYSKQELSQEVLNRVHQLR